MRTLILMSRGLLAAAALAIAAPAAAQPVCTGNSNLMQWPSTNPVWKFCWLRPSNSSGPNGSGLEITDAYYRDHLVFKRAHAPILNVLYAAGGCGCYRDWSRSEIRFQSTNQLSPGYSEPATPPVTVCENGGSHGDLGSFTGVAAQKLTDRLVMTTQLQAGWYRYNMEWTFHYNGRIEPRFSFAAVQASCVAFDHTHHNYWRFDFDIDGAGNDAVLEAPANPGGPRLPVKMYSREMTAKRREGILWTVKDTVTGRGYRIVPGDEMETPADTFAVSDMWLLRYRSNEIDDAGQSGPACAIKFNNFLNNEALDDIVVWYRGGAFHKGSELDDCHYVGPKLEPVGDWTVPGTPTPPPPAGTSAVKR